MAILQSIGYQGQTFTIPSKLSELADTNIPANPAVGSILTLQNGEWTPTASVLNTPLTGLNTSQSGAVTASDTVLSAMGKMNHVQIAYPTDILSGVNCQVKFTRIGRIVIIGGLSSISSTIAANNRLAVATVPTEFSTVPKVNDVCSSNIMGISVFINDGDNKIKFSWPGNTSTTYISFYWVGVV